MAIGQGVDRNGDIGGARRGDCDAGCAGRSQVGRSSTGVGGIVHSQRIGALGQRSGLNVKSRGAGTQRCCGRSETSAGERHAACRPTTVAGYCGSDNQVLRIGMSGLFGSDSHGWSDRRQCDSNRPGPGSTVISCGAGAVRRVFSRQGGTARGQRSRRDRNRRR